MAAAGAAAPAPAKPGPPAAGQSPASHADGPDEDLIAAAGASQAVPACAFQCGRKMGNMSDMRNLGSVRWPKWACAPCYNASKALTRAACTPALKQELARRRKLEPDAVRQEVVDMSFMDTKVGSRSSARLVAARQFCERLSHWTSVVTRYQVHWLTRSAYIAFAKYTLGKEDSIAEGAKWDEWLADRTIPRGKSPDGEITEGQRGSEVMRQVTTSEHHAAEDAADAIVKRARLGCSLAFTDTGLGADNVEVFRSLGLGSVSTVASAVSAPVATLTSGSASTAGSSGTLSSLAQARAKTLPELRKVHQQSLGQRAPLAICSELIRVLGDDNPEVRKLNAAAVLQSAQNLQKKLSETYEAAETWTQENYVERTAAATQLLQDFRDALESVQTVIPPLRQIKHQRQQRACASRRQVRKAVAQLTAPWQRHRLPEQVAEIIREIFFHQDGSFSSDRFLDTKAVVRDVDVDGEGWRTPARLPDAVHSNLIDFYGRDKLESRWQKLKENFATHPDISHNMLRYVYNEAAEQEAKWMHKGWGKMDMKLLTNAAAPWMLASRPNTFRAGHNLQPLQGSAFVLTVLSGTIAIFTWPLASTARDSWITDDAQGPVPMSNDGDWARQHMWGCILTEGQAMYLPVGWVYAAGTFAVDHPSAWVQQPLLADVVLDRSAKPRGSLRLPACQQEAPGCFYSSRCE